MEYEGELYAERLRLTAQAAEVSSGTLHWTESVSELARRKLKLAWDDARTSLYDGDRVAVQTAVKVRTNRSLGYQLDPTRLLLLDDHGDYLYSSEELLSLVEAEHEALVKLDSASSPWGSRPLTESGDEIDYVGNFRRDVNYVFEAHLVGFHLHANSRLVPIKSSEMHSAVVEPTLYLLHSQPRFAAAEKAYQDALAELRKRDAGDAITDAGTALQSALAALGLSGNTLGDQLKAAKKSGLIRGNDTPLTEAVIQWVASQRNHGEAHRADHEFTMSDAWMVVHVVGALVIRLAEAAPPAV